VHPFFQEFINNQSGPTVQENPTFNHNNMVLEIANNWPFVRWTLWRYNEGKLKTVDLMEQDWLNFIIKNNIDVEKYGKDSDSFLKDHLKPLTT
jgi:hypothetical protein